MPAACAKFKRNSIERSLFGGKGVEVQRLSIARHQRIGRKHAVLASDAKWRDSSSVQSTPPYAFELEGEYYIEFTKAEVSRHEPRTHWPLPRSTRRGRQKASE